jgi:Rhamnan synthesis protein F
MQCRGSPAGGRQAYDLQDYSFCTSNLPSNADGRRRLVCWARLYGDAEGNAVLIAGQRGLLAPPLATAASPARVGLRSRVSLPPRMLMPAPGPAMADLVFKPPGGRRLFHTLAYQAPFRFAGRVLEVGTEVAWAQVRDAAAAFRPGDSQVQWHERGGATPVTAGRRIALYAHYTPSGIISSMVREQLAAYRDQGFDVILITNSETVEESSWREAADHCWWMVRRRNLGFDFGAWRDAAALLLAGRTPPDELLLVNDSVLGPIHPLGPVLARARAMGNGAVGLTESHQGGVHLQSYFVLALGRAATADTLEFLAGLNLSRGKWLMVQRGEFGLTRHLLCSGHRVSALFGYAQALDAILACPVERRYLAALVPKAVRYGETPERLRQLFLRWPLNPTHHLWRGLPRCLDFPFLKTALIRRNPGRLLGLEEWPALIGRNAPASAELMREHLAQL